MHHLLVSWVVNSPFFVSLAQLGTTLEIGVRLSPRQFDKYGAALGEVLNEMLEEGGKGEAYWEYWERGLLSEMSSTGLKEVILVLGTG